MSPPTNCKVISEWGSIRSRVSAGWPNKCPWRPSLCVCVSQQGPWISFTSADELHLCLLIITCSTATQDHSNGCRKIPSGAFLLTNCWWPMPDAATCPHWIPLFVQGFQLLESWGWAMLLMAAWPLQVLVVARWGPPREMSDVIMGPSEIWMVVLAVCLLMAASYWTSQGQAELSMWA
jgi:hypothetical protein